MIHKLHFPQLPLSQFVENMWLVQNFAAGYKREKILPDGAIELIIDLDTQPKSIFKDEASAVRVRSCDFVDRSDLSDKQNDPLSNTKHHEMRSENDQ